MATEDIEAITERLDKVERSLEEIKDLLKAFRLLSRIIKWCTAVGAGTTAIWFGFSSR